MFYIIVPFIVKFSRLFDILITHSPYTISTCGIFTWENGISAPVKSRSGRSNEYSATSRQIALAAANEMLCRIRPC